MSGGSETQTSTSTGTQTREPWGPAAGRIQDALLPLVDQWGAQSQQYTGPSYIPRTDLGVLGRDNLLMGSSNLIGTINEPTYRAWAGNLDPMNRLRAPGAMNPLNMYASEVGRALDENIRPGYAMGAIGAGHTGGYSSERAQQDLLAQRNAQEAISKYGSGLFSDLYAQGLGAQQNAIAQAPGLAQLALAPHHLQAQLGAQDRAELQRQQAMAGARTAFEQQEPLRRAQAMAGLYYPAASLGGTATSEQTQMQEQEREGSLLGGLLSGGMMLGGLMGGGGGFGGLGGIGSALGGLFGGGSAPAAPAYQALPGSNPWVMQNWGYM